MTQKRLKVLLRYDPKSGMFIHLTQPNGRVKAGSIAGHLSTKGYVVLGVDGKVYKAHRLVWLYVHGAWPKGQIDHMNGDKSDNRVENLRPVLQVTNSENISRPRKDNKSGYLGVSPRGSRWQAQIRAQGKVRHLGFYSSPVEAHTAYCKAKAELHPGWIR